VVKKLPKGLDQQGRYPEAAHAATEIDSLEREIQSGVRDAVVAVCVAAAAMGTGLLVAWLL
jgi:hypothetical protein